MSSVYIYLDIVKIVGRKLTNLNEYFIKILKSNISIQIVWPSFRTNLKKYIFLHTLINILQNDTNFIKIARILLIL